ncbi:hypothetical protein MC885_008278, partial [Smutsia gigantea]
ARQSTPAATNGTRAWHGQPIEWWQRRGDDSAPHRPPASGLPGGGALRCFCCGSNLTEPSRAQPSSVKRSRTQPSPAESRAGSVAAARAPPSERASGSGRGGGAAPGGGARPQVSEPQSAPSILLPWTLPRARTGLNSVCAGLTVLPVMGAAISQGALIAIVCNGLVGFLLLLLWVILCWACHSRSADIDSLSESSPNSSPGPCPEKAPPPQKPSHEGSYLLQP